MKCEICDRDVFDVWYAARAWQEAIGFASHPDTPPGDACGWEVVMAPKQSASFHEYVRIAAGRSPAAYRIFTCGGEVCRYRARMHGVPGRSYPQFVERTDVRPSRGRYNTVVVSREEMIDCCRWPEHDPGDEDAASWLGAPAPRSRLRDALERMGHA